MDGSFGVAFISLVNVSHVGDVPVGAWGWDASQWFPFCKQAFEAV